jgi:F-type H+-transporting ATPase subunit b
MKKSGFFRHPSTLKVIGVMITLFLGQATAAFAVGIEVIPDKTVVIQLINFLILVVILNIVLIKPIRKIVAQRKEKVSGLEGSIDKSNQDAEEKSEAFNAGVREARSKGTAEKETRVQEGAEEEKRILEGINKKNQADLMEIREKIAGDVDKVRASLQEEVDAFAADIGQKILGRAF